MIIYTFVTDDSYFQKALELQASLGRFPDIQLTIKRMEDKKNWLHNCCYKPEVCLEMLEKHGEGLFLDADCIVAGDPDWSQLTDFDMAWVWAETQPSTSLLWLRKTERTMTMLKLWKEALARAPQPDAFMLHRCWSQLRLKPSTGFLDCDRWLVPKSKRGDKQDVAAWVEHDYMSHMVGEEESFMPAPRMAQLVGKLEGAHVIVAGCGPSAASLQPYCKDYWTMGVNDIGRYWQPDFLVLCDSEGSYRSQSRWHYIEATQASMVFYNHRMPLNLNHPAMVSIDYQLAPLKGIDLKDPTVSTLWRTSTMAAVGIAYRLGAVKIGLIGADFTTDHSTHDALPSIDKYYRQIVSELESLGVSLVNLSPVSRLTSVPFGNLRDFDTKQKWTDRMILAMAQRLPALTPDDFQEQL